jgi:hypothetical protein
MIMNFRQQSATFVKIEFLTAVNMNTTLLRGPGSVVGIATGYELDGPGIESRWGVKLPAPVQTGPGYRIFPGGKERSGRDADPSPPSSGVGHERVELYLSSPYGPLGLYRASVPVQSFSACTEPQCLYKASVPVQSLSACTRVHFTSTFYVLPVIYSIVCNL